MSNPKLGLYRHCVNQIRKEYKVTALDFDVVLYLSEKDSTSKYDLWKHVSPSRGSVTQSLTYLEKAGFIKVVRKHRPGVRGVSGLYAVKGKGRSMVTDFYMKMFPNHF